MISIILLNHNDSHHTINCLKSLQKQTFKNFEIILIDDNSLEHYRNQLLDFLHEDYLPDTFLKKIKLIQARENLGYTGACNLGIKNSKGDLILHLDNDTHHDASFLEKMNFFFEKYKFVHIAQPKINFYNDKNIVWINGIKIDKFRIHIFKAINHLEEDNDLIEKPFKIDSADGCALFIKRDVLKKIGLYDNDYSIYCESKDLCYRAALKGYDNIYCNPRVKIYHDTQAKMLYHEYYFRNLMIFFLKFFPVPLIFLRIFFLLIQAFFFAFSKKRFSFKLLWFSIKWIMNGLIIGLKKRIMI